MSKLDEIRERMLSGGTVSTDDLVYTLDIIDVIESYILIESQPPDICHGCKYFVAGVKYYNCDHELDDCQVMLEEFFERALARWYKDKIESEDKDNDTLH